MINEMLVGINFSKQLVLVPLFPCTHYPTRDLQKWLGLVKVVHHAHFRYLSTISMPVMILTNFNFKALFYQICFLFT